MGGPRDDDARRAVREKARARTLAAVQAAEDDDLGLGLRWPALAPASAAPAESARSRWLWQRLKPGR